MEANLKSTVSKGQFSLSLYVKVCQYIWHGVVVAFGSVIDMELYWFGCDYVAIMEIN